MSNTVVTYYRYP